MTWRVSRRDVDYEIVEGFLLNSALEYRTSVPIEWRHEADSLPDRGRLTRLNTVLISAPVA